jgi:enoyl-CoA hydratase/carnithine racemase
MWMELQSLVSQLETDQDVRVVVFRGAGDRAFSAGADIREFEARRNNSAQARSYAEAYEGALQAIDNFAKPTISLIKGACTGGGCELASTTDIRIAADNARFLWALFPLSCLWPRWSQQLKNWPEKSPTWHRLCTVGTSRFYAPC